jgi:hypothetical protein
VASPDGSREVEVKVEVKVKVEVERSPGGSRGGFAARRVPTGRGRLRLRLRLRLRRGIIHEYMNT